ncbi:hypothetical protein [Aneurinibacillus tyrosinisolvens]|uniref:hypothetical protein n=1 Tax=Aneurinibacillus tyrosinisolvens TaxID=1443435 RepID=UPI00063F0055|nr:hypothetical protein [Aneurinibacillus tyrosinisolvens]
MTLELIQIELEQIENQMFNHSLYQKSLRDLIEMESRVLSLKDKFLRFSFLGKTVAELDTVRFKLNETALNIRISLKERLGESIKDGLVGLNELYQTSLPD